MAEAWEPMPNKKGRSLPWWKTDGTPFARFTPRRPWVMPVSAAYKDFLKDLLAGFGPVSIRNMFSGAGVYAAA